MKTYILSFLIIIFSISSAKAGTKKDYLTKYLEKWFEKGDISYSKAKDGYDLRVSENKDVPLVHLSENLYDISDFLYFDVYIEVLRYPKRNYSACCLLKDIEQPLIGTIYSKTESNEDILYLIYELPLDLSSTSLNSVVEYISEYSMNSKSQILQLKEILDQKESLK